MNTAQNPGTRPEVEPDTAPERPITKKQQILSLYAAGITEVEDLAAITHSRPSHVASVLQQEEKLPGYFDLYTSTGQSMNIYSKFFARKLGFKDVETAQRSMDLIDHYYRQFEFAADRAGQHHALTMALMMFDRARWTGKGPEAHVFRRWLMDRLNEFAPARPEAAVTTQRPERAKAEV